jgi:hypothetical protein
MRQERTVQATIFEVFAGHQIGCQLKAISRCCAWLRSSHPLRCTPRPTVPRSGQESRLNQSNWKAEFAVVLLAPARECIFTPARRCIFFPALTPHAIRARARRQEGRGGELPGRALCCATRRCRAAVPGVRQNPDSCARRDCREQRIGAALAFARERQASYPPNRRRGDPRASGRQTIWRHRVCRQRAGYCAKFWRQLRPSETTPAAGCHFYFAR